MLMNASGELLSQCQAKISALNLADEIQFLDQIESWNDLHKAYLASDILLLPANFSAGNLTIIESMASGMGIVVSNKILGPGIDYIEHGKNGFICNPDVDDFVSAIDAYHQSPDLLRTHGEINKTLAKRYSIAETAVLWNKLLSHTVF
jgi:glycosyltransferase involved in cell wall biosynthesis